MIDTHAIARSLTDADLTPAQADAITAAVRIAAEHDAAGIDVDALATKADLHALEARLAWRLVSAGVAIAAIAVGAGVTLTVAVLRAVE